MQENDTVLTYNQLCLSRASWLICFFPILFFGFSPLQGQQIGIYGYRMREMLRIPSISSDNTFGKWGRLQGRFF